MAGGSKLVSIGVAAAMSSPLLFEPYFRGESWDTWRAIMRAAYGEPMSDADVALFRAVADREPPKAPVSEFVCAVGRGGGKDSVASLIACVTAINFDPKGKLRPGEKTTVMCLACDRSQAGILFGYVKAYFETIPALASLVVHMGAESIELKNNVVIAVHTNSFRAIRGRTLLCVIFDEAAFFRSEESASPDVELDSAVGPGLARMQGSMKIIISSVHKRSGLLYEKVRQYYGKSDPDTLVIVGKTLKLNPSFDKRIIDRALEQDPERYGAEYLCKWRDDISSFIALDLLDAAVDPGVTVRPPIHGANYVAACDASGGRVDSFTAAICHRETDGSVVLDCMFERKSPFDPSIVVAEVAGMLREYRIDRITGDHYSAAWVVEAFAKAGIKYIQSERDRSAIYADTLPLFTTGRVRLLDDKKLVSQFSSLERRVLATGRERIEPGPQHDDAANACAIAMTLVGSDGPPVLIKYEGFLVKGKPHTGPTHHYYQFKSMAVSPDGKCAVILWRGHRHINPQLILEDFATGYFSERRFNSDLRYLSMCFNSCGLRKVAAIVTGGYYDSDEKDVVVDFGFAPIASRLVEGGNVKIGEAAHGKSTLATLHDALDFRLDRLTDPLNAAAIAGVVKLLHVE